MRVGLLGHAEIIRSGVTADALVIRFDSAAGPPGAAACSYSAHDILARRDAGELQGDKASLPVSFSGGVPSAQPFEDRRQGASPLGSCWKSSRLILVSRLRRSAPHNRGKVLFLPHEIAQLDLRLLGHCPVAATAPKLARQAMYDPACPLLLR